VLITLGIEERIRDAVKDVVALLVAREYAKLERRSAGIRLSAEDMRRAVEEYGRTLRMPPDEVFGAFSLGEVRGSVPKAWWIVIDLWTKEEGRSDLSLEMTIVDVGDQFRIEVDNIHVM
jgi:hypothetical protein